MAAKVATRSKSSVVEDGERYVVVNTNTMRRVYGGPGVDEKTATALAETLVVPAIAVPIAHTISGKYVPPASGEALETGAGKPVAA